MDGTFSPKTGVSEHGRHVVVSTNVMAYEQWKERRERMSQARKELGQEEG